MPRMLNLNIIYHKSYENHLLQKKQCFLPNLQNFCKQYHTFLVIEYIKHNTLFVNEDFETECSEVNEPAVYF